MPKIRINPQPVFAVGLPGTRFASLTKSFSQERQGWADYAEPGQRGRSGLDAKIFEHLLKLLKIDPEGIDPLPPIIMGDIKHIARTCAKRMQQNSYESEQPWMLADVRLLLFWSAMRKAFPRAHWLILRQPLEQAVASCLSHPVLGKRSEDPAFWRRVCAEYIERQHTLCDNEHRFSIQWANKPAATHGESLEYVRHHANAEPLKIQGRVAVVGNSDTLASSNWGQRIDSYDTVIRFNLAPCGGKLRNQVGEKTTHRLISRGISKDQYEEVAATGETVPLICYPGHFRNFDTSQREIYQQEICAPQMNRMFAEILGSQYQGFGQVDTPRNGIKLLSCLIHAGIKPDLFGFDVEERDANTHYFDDELQEEKERGHKPSMEFRLLTQLADAGRLRLIR